jgi:hypothetical protein
MEGIVRIAVSPVHCISACNCAHHINDSDDNAAIELGRAGTNDITHIKHTTKTLNALLSLYQ